MQVVHVLHMHSLRLALCGELSVLITYVISCTYHFLYHCFLKCCVMCAFSQLLLLLWYDNLLLSVLYELQACDITIHTDGFDSDKICTLCTGGG